MNRFATALLTTMLFLMLSPLQADNVERFDGYTVYYNVFNADILDKRVLEAHKLRSGCGDGILTVAVRKEDGSAVAAQVKATAQNLVGQRSTISVREVRDGRSLYYIGGFAITTDAEPLAFAISVRPEGEAGERRVEFTRQLYRC